MDSTALHARQGKLFYYFTLGTQYRLINTHIKNNINKLCSSGRIDDIAMVF